MRHILLGLLLFVGSASAAHAGVLRFTPFEFLDLESKASWAYCEIRDVPLIAEDVKACERAGGRVTHHVVGEIKAVQDDE